MSIVTRLRDGKLIRLFAGSPLLGNRRSLRGEDNRVVSPHAALCMKTIFHVRGRGNRIELGNAILRNVQIRVFGDGNTIHIGDGTRITDTMLWITASNCRITFTGPNRLHNCELGVEGNGGVITLAPGVMLGGFVWLGDRPNSTEKVRLYAGSEEIAIAEDTCVSDDVTMRSTDSHDILTLDGQVLNTPEPVRVGKRCWIGSGAVILKGGGVGNECVVGARSVVTRDFSDRDHVILAGMPAKVVREGVTWRL